MQGHVFKYGVLNPLAELKQPEGSVKIETRCACGDMASFEVEIVAFHPKARAVDPEWDGVVLPNIVVCARCGAEDSYTVQPSTLARLRVRAAAGRPGDPVIGAELRSWDGSVTKRPARQLEHLRSLTERHPSSGQAWRRYGNVLEKVGRSVQAEGAWRRAVEVDDTEFPAAVSLANVAYCEARADLWLWIERALDRIPGERLRRAQRAEQDSGMVLAPGHAAGEARERSSCIAELLRMLAEQASVQPLGLTVAWLAGRGDRPVITLSELDLGALTRWDRLHAVLDSDHVVGAKLSEPPSDDEERSMLHQVIESDVSLDVLASLARSAAPKRSNVWRSSSRKKKRTTRTKQRESA